MKGAIAMDKIEISKEYVKTGSEHSSRGNQLKWKQDGYWYKADRLGFESLSEAVVSRLLKHANVEEIVDYEPVMIDYKGIEYRGCRSLEFKKEKEELVSVERLAKKYTSFGLAKEFERIPDLEQRILYTVELVENVTGLENFGAYLTKMLEMDAFFLNEGRHTDNILLLYDTQKQDYHYCPVFDMGHSLFSDEETCPLEDGLLECYHRVEAKPFAPRFDEQLRAATKLYGRQLKFDISVNEMINVVRDMVNSFGKESAYLNEEIRRIGEIFRYQAQKYKYMFKRF